MGKYKINYDIKKNEDGTYLFGSKRLILKMLKNRLMVRKGGGF